MGLWRTVVMYFLRYRWVAPSTSTESLTDWAYKWSRTTWFGTGSSEGSFRRGSELSVASLRCGGSKGGASASSNTGMFCEYSPGGVERPNEVSTTEASKSSKVPLSPLSSATTDTLSRLLRDPNPLATTGASGSCCHRPSTMYLYWC